MDRLLVVDDEEDLRNMLRRQLSSEGYEVDQAKNKEEALEKMRQYLYPVVLLDIKFPKSSGTNILEELKRIHPPVNVVMITGYASMENVMECFSKGAVDCFKKPLDVDELRQRLSELDQKVQRLRDELGIQ